MGWWTSLIPATWRNVCHFPEEEGEKKCWQHGKWNDFNLRQQMLKKKGLHCFSDSTRRICLDNTRIPLVFLFYPTFLFRRSISFFSCPIFKSKVREVKKKRRCDNVLESRTIFSLSSLFISPQIQKEEDIYQAEWPSDHFRDGEEFSSIPFSSCFHDLKCFAGALKRKKRGISELRVSFSGGSQFPLKHYCCFYIAQMPRVPL